MAGWCFSPLCPISSPSVFRAGVQWAGAAGGGTAATSPPTPGFVEPRGLVPTMCGSLPPLQCHGDHFWHTGCGRSREAEGSSHPQGDVCRAVLLAPPGKGSRHAW